MNANALFSVLLLTALSLPAAAQSNLKCSSKELSAHPFTYREVTIQITKLHSYKAFDSERKFSGRANVCLTIANKSTQQFQRFDPQDLSFVGKDGIQVFPIFQRNFTDVTVPMSLRLAPGARATTEYALTGRLSFPVKVYVGDTLVADVSE